MKRTCITHLAFLIFLAWPKSAVADIIYETNFYGGNVGEYNAITGAAINGSLVSGLSFPTGIALDGAGHLYVVNGGAIGRVSEYNSSTGAVINANLISGLGQPEGIALDGAGHLFVVNGGSGTIGEYNASTGASINGNFITGLSLYPQGIALDGAGHLFVATGYGNGPGNNLGVIGEYNASTGTAINATLITGLGNEFGDEGPTGIALDGSGHLYVADSYSSNVGEYNANTGAVIHSSLIDLLFLPTGIALDGSNLYVVSSSSNAGKIELYNANTGVAIDTQFITGLNTPEYIAIQSSPSVVPEPSSLLLLGLGTAALAFRAWTLRRKPSGAR